MADMPNVPGAPQGAEPMKKSTGKVQPKKETVRINLPPKPSAAPTIKLPTLPPGGPTNVPMAPTAPAPAARPAPAAPVQRTTAAPRPGAPVAAAHRPAVATISPVDKVLAIIALIAVLVAVGTTLYLSFFFKDLGS